VICGTFGLDGCMAHGSLDASHEGEESYTASVMGADRAHYKVAQVVKERWNRVPG
jgi:hypothetical protein